MTSKKVPRLRVALGPEHAPQALRRDAREGGQAFKPDRAVDVVSQQRLAHVEIAGEEAIDGLLQDSFPEAGRPDQAGTHGLFEILGERHGPGSLPLLVVLPTLARIRDVARLALLRPAAEQNHDRRAVLAEIHTQAGTEIDPVLKDTVSDALDAGEGALLDRVRAWARQWSAACALRVTSRRRVHARVAARGAPSPADWLGASRPA